MPAPDIAAEWIPIADLVPWDENPRHNDDAVDEVAGSIQRFGFAAPIIARRADSMVIAGHTRLKAAHKLGINKVPVRWMDLDPAEARLLALADNKLNERAAWDDDTLAAVLEALNAEGADLDGLGWDSDEIDALIATIDPVELPGPGLYTAKIKVPVYEPTGERPEEPDLVDTTKTDELLAQIDVADIPDEVRTFLVHAAQRHTSFHFRKVAEYYAHADEKVQDLMERSALVIIDYDKAIEGGFVAMSDRLSELAGQDETTREAFVNA